MGVVYEAEDDLLKKTVAIKTIKKGVLTAEHVIRFQREANALAALNHPNLVPIYIFGITDDNEPYMVMQFEPGKALSDVIEARGRLPAFKSINIFVQLCDAIQHAHEHGVLHRDLKPSNVIVRNPESEHPQVVIIDFGIAMMESSNAIDALTKTGLILGTPAYMSPEQVLGKEPDERSDIYALGCIMYETLTGSQPFSASSALELLSIKSTSTAPPLNSTFADLTFPSGLEAIVAKCLATDPEDRYQSVADLKLDLVGLKSGDLQLPPDQTSPEPSTPITPRARKKPLSKKRLALLLLGTLVLAGSAFTVWKLNSEKTVPPELANPKVKDPMAVVPPSAGKFVDGTLFFTGMCMDPVTASDRTAVADLVKYGKEVNRIEITDTRITGTCFDNFSKLPLKDLICSDSEISDTGLQSISKISSLKTLSLSNETNFSKAGLAHLKELPKLYSLIVLNCNIDESKVETICTLDKLTDLSVEGNLDFGDRELAMIVKSLPKLKYLCISATGVTNDGLKYLSDLKHLKKLRIKTLNLSSAGLETLSKLPHLECLDIKENPKVRDEDLKFIQRMKSLTKLEVDSPQVTKQAKLALSRKMKGLKVDDCIDLKNLVD